MKIKLKWKYAEGEFETKDITLVAIHGCRVKGERSAEIAIKDGWNLSIGTVDMGATQVEDANILVDEIVRRFNEFPENDKR